jgi:hypothetical protein
MTGEHPKIGGGLTAAKTDPEFDPSLEDRVEAAQDGGGDAGLLLVAEEVDFIRDGFRRLGRLQKDNLVSVDKLETRIAGLETRAGALEVLGNALLKELRAVRGELGTMRSAVVAAVDKLRPEHGSGVEGGN